MLPYLAHTYIVYIYIYIYIYICVCVCVCACVCVCMCVYRSCVIVNICIRLYISLLLKTNAREAGYKADKKQQ